MNTLLLQPTDVLFFRDGRPMEGSLAGHGAAWPLPTVTDAALHAALHRSAIQGHKHRRGRSAAYQEPRDRTFGSLVTAGPFPVSPDGDWYFPCPLDLAGDSPVPTLHPTALTGHSSLPAPLQFGLLNIAGPSKESHRKPWLSAAAFERYLAPAPSAPVQAFSGRETLEDAAIFGAEAAVGIAIDPDTQTTGHGDTRGKIYSARYLRLREGWRLGVLARTDEKRGGGDAPRADLIPELITASQHLIVGGQQRTCTAICLRAPQPLPLPQGRTAGFNVATINGRTCHLVKWVLLTPALWPEIAEGLSQRGTRRQAHPGGWLPTWVAPQTGNVLLRTVTREVRRERRKLHYDGRGYATDHGGAAEIKARLVAALVPQPIVVTGWALAHAEAERAEGGAKPTHLAVPAGAVYYFACDSEPDARALAAALNWHGGPEEVAAGVPPAASRENAVPNTASDPAGRMPASTIRDPAGTKPASTIRDHRSTPLGEKGFGVAAGVPPAASDPAGTRSPSTIRNRRSTLLGEKGFGLGVCGTWQLHGTSRT